MFIWEMTVVVAAINIDAYLFLALSYMICHLKMQEQVFPGYTVPSGSKENKLGSDPEVLPFPSNKAKLFTKDFSKNSNIDEQGTSSNYPSRTNLKPHNIPVTHILIDVQYFSNLFLALEKTQMFKIIKSQSW